MTTQDPKLAGPLPVATYILTWLTLLVLTALTVTAAMVSWGGKSIFVALSVAAAKSVLVLTYFMHLRHEARIFRVLFLITVLALTVFIVLTFTDVAFR
jgi:cytochrome c oxidase subunit 4